MRAHICMRTCVHIHELACALTVLLPAPCFLTAQQSGRLRPTRMHASCVALCARMHRRSCMHCVHACTASCVALCARCVRVHAPPAVLHCVLAACASICAGMPRARICCTSARGMASPGPRRLPTWPPALPQRCALLSGCESAWPPALPGLLLCHGSASLGCVEEGFEDWTRGCKGGCKGLKGW